VLDGAVERGTVSAGDGDAEDSPGFEEVLDQRLRAAIDGNRVDDGVARARVGHDRRHDGGHAGVEDGGGLGLIFEWEQMGFDDLGVRMVEAGIDEIGGFTRLGFDAAAEDGECPFGGLGRGEDVGAGTEDGRAGGADGESGVKTGGQDRGGGVDFSLSIAHAPIVA
jgi:hypothetical protein